MSPFNYGFSTKRSLPIAMTTFLFLHVSLEPNDCRSR